MESSGNGGDRERRPVGGGLKLALALVVVVGLAAGGYGLWYLFLRPPAPAAVDLPDDPSAGAGATPRPADSAAAASPSPADAGAAGVDGTWSVDPGVGSFEDFTSSFVGYRVQEELASIGGNIAVGRTPRVSGTLTVEGTRVIAGEITADLTALQSDDARRDGQLRRQSLETDRYPTATFRLTAPIELGSVPIEGQTLRVEATGELTLHGQTRAVQIPVEARLTGDVMTVTGSLEITFADYGMQKPTSFIVLSVADTGTLELQLHFRRA